MDMILGSNNGQMLMRLMSAATQRGAVLASNLSNINTPGYKRRELRFEDSLLEAMQRGTSTDIQPEVVVDFDTPGRPDGNNVTLEQEITDGDANMLMYETYATILDGHFRILSSAIHGDR